MIVGIVIAVIVVLLVLWAVGSYNSLVALRNRVANGWAQIDVQLKQRADLVPNLVETVKGYAAHEQQTLSDDRARLIDQVNHAREAAAAEVAEQVSALEHRVEDRDDRIMKMTQHQRRLVWLFIAILVVCIVGSVCIGLIYGTLNGASLISSIDAVVLS